MINSSRRMWRSYSVMKILDGTFSQIIENGKLGITANFCRYHWNIIEIKLMNKLFGKLTSELTRHEHFTFPILLHVSNLISGKTCTWFLYFFSVFLVQISKQLWCFQSTWETNFLVAWWHFYWQTVSENFENSLLAIQTLHAFTSSLSFTYKLHLPEIYDSLNDNFLWNSF